MTTRVLSEYVSVCACLVTQSYPTLCDPIDCSPAGSFVHGILQARILEWVAIPFSRGSSWPGTESRSPALQVDLLPSEPPGTYEYLILNVETTSQSTPRPCRVTVPRIFTFQAGIWKMLPWEMNHWKTERLAFL